MANLATALKEEISRLARKELKSEADALKKASSRYRSDIAELKRKVVDLERLLARATKAGGLGTAAVKENGKVRFSPKGIKIMRDKLGLSQGRLAEILGVSLPTIGNWESGKTRPKPDQIQAIATLKKTGKRELKARLSERG